MLGASILQLQGKKTSVSIINAMSLTHIEAIALEDFFKIYLFWLVIGLTITCN